MFFFHLMKDNELHFLTVILIKRPEVNEMAQDEDDTSTYCFKVQNPDVVINHRL